MILLEMITGNVVFLTGVICYDLVIINITKKGEGRLLCLKSVIILLQATG
jgi:hypothetical protein